MSTALGISRNPIFVETAMHLLDRGQRVAPRLGHEDRVILDGFRAYRANEVHEGVIVNRPEIGTSPVGLALGRGR